GEGGTRMFQAGNVTVMVSDMERAVRFYAETLGLALTARYGDEWAEVQAPGLTIGLHPAGAHGPQPGQAGRLSMGLQVAQLAPAIAALKEKGVVFSSPATEGGPERMAFFADPDNNPLYLRESPA